MVRRRISYKDVTALDVVLISVPAPKKRFRYQKREYRFILKKEWQFVKQHQPKAILKKNIPWKTRIWVDDDYDLFIITSDDGRHLHTITIPCEYTFTHFTKHGYKHLQKSIFAHAVPRHKKT